MGIVNANPDSFSDEGAHAGTERAVRHGLRLAEQGADVVEVGGESLRFSAPSPVEVEIGRVAPVIEAPGGARSGCRWRSTPTSRRSPRAAIAAGAAVLNDPTGLREPEMRRVAAEGGVGVVMTHFFGEPKVRPTTFPDVDVLEAVTAWAGQRMREAAEAGIPAERIVIDPGVGLGKSPAQDLDLLHRIDRGRRPSGARCWCRSPTRRCSAPSPARRPSGGCREPRPGSSGARARGATHLPGPQRALPPPGPARSREALVTGRAERWHDVEK